MELNAKNPNEYLPEALQKDYEVVNWPDGVSLAAFPAFQSITPNGNVNLKTMTAAKAEQLIAAGFPNLKRKEVKATKAVAEPTPEKATK